MSNLILLLQNPTFIAVITAFTLVLLFIGFVCFNLLARLNNIEKSMKIVGRANSDVAANLMNFSLQWDKWVEHFDNKNNQMSTVIEQIRYEQELLTKVLGSKNKLSKAIELARSGSTVDEIMLKAGISSDEAKAVARFHGPGEAGC